jgi:NAD(P)-dependent dehydrogenase (short-subunit alcohol dehydrogenase family)
MGKLSGQTALITGGNSGIGRAVAMLFAAEGAAVMIAARNAETGQATVNHILSSGGPAAFVACDVRRYDDCQHAVDETMRAFGHIDILFNNAGIVPFGTATETPLDTWQDVLDTNISGTFFMCRAALPHLIAQQRGVIVNNGSDWSISGGRAAVAYCATKGAVAQITRALALDHARQGIRVNAICPGDTYVERWNIRLAPGQTVESYLAELGTHFPMGRVGTVDEIARAVLFLASDDSSYMTGQLLVVDGGNTAGNTAVSYP